MAIFTIHMGSAGPANPALTTLSTLTRHLGRTTTFNPTVVAKRFELGVASLQDELEWLASNGYLSRKAGSDAYRFTEPGWRYTLPDDE